MATRREERDRGRAAAVRRLRSRPVRILDALAQAAGGLSTPQLVALLGERIQDHQQALTKYGEVLRFRESAGHVERAGETEGSWQQGPAVIWRITSAGRAWLRECEREASRAPVAGAAEDAEEARLAAGRKALADAAQHYSRDTPADVRIQVARELRYAGCSLKEIGQVFGVTGEAIRLILLPAARERRQ